LRVDRKKLFDAAEQDDSRAPSFPQVEVGSQVDELQTLRESMARRLDELLALVQATRGPSSLPPGLDPHRIAEQVKAELLGALPAIISNALDQAMQKGAGQAGGSTPIEALRQNLRDQVAKWMGGLNAVEPPALLSDNRALADELFRQAALSGHLFSITPRECFDEIAMEIRKCVLLLAPSSYAGDAERKTVTTGETRTAPETATPLSPRQAHGTLRPSGSIDLTLLGAYRDPEANRSYGQIYLNVERAFPEVCLYNRLQTFAGRTLSEIATLVEESPETIERWLGDFENELERNEAAMNHEH
jgi:hypothetical protein